MNEPHATHKRPLLLKYLPPGEVRAHIERDPRLIVPVGTTEQHGPHLPLGCDTIIIERLADDLSAEFQVLRAPTIEYGVNAHSVTHLSGSASIHSKSLHRLLNDLVGSWEAGGIQQFVILTAHGADPHQEALSTLHTKEARVRTVDIFSASLPGTQPVVHGGEIDTSLLLYVAGDLVQLDLARDYEPPKGISRRYRRGGRRAIPDSSPGSLGRPTIATVKKGEEVYRFIYERIATRILGVP